MIELGKWYQAAYVLERGSSQHVVQKGILFEDVTELSKWYQAAYVLEKGIKSTRSLGGDFIYLLLFFFFVCVCVFFCALTFA